VVPAQAHTKPLDDMTDEMSGFTAILRRGSEVGHVYLIDQYCKTAGENAEGLILHNQLISIGPFIIQGSTIPW
jgi:hypothetical protein